MEGITIGVFGTDQAVKAAFQSAIAKKSEAAGISVYHRTEGGRRFSFLDASDFPDRIQGYACLASIVDCALYLFPPSSKVSAPDGELAVLVEAAGLPGRLVIFDGLASPASAAAALRGTSVAGFPIEERPSSSGAFNRSDFLPRLGWPQEGSLVYVDLAFAVKGVGTVALGFVLSGRVAIHSQLTPIPFREGPNIDVKGIQVNDVDVEEVGRGVRVGLSLRGVDAEELETSHWLSEGPIATTDELELEIVGSPFHRGEVAGRGFHVEIAGETIPAEVSSDGEGQIRAKLPWNVPFWKGMKVIVLDINGKPLRVAGGATCNF